MKRKVTDLEQRLINNGYRLLVKYYGGKKSEKTIAYLYVKGDAFIRLDQTREKVLSCGLRNVNVDYLTKLGLDELRLRLYNVEQDYKHDNEERAKEPCTELPCSEEEVVEHIKSMTPEQMDEFDLEKEREKLDLGDVPCH